MAGVNQVGFRLTGGLLGWPELEAAWYIYNIYPVRLGQSVHIRVTSQSQNLRQSKLQYGPLASVNPISVCRSFVWLILRKVRLSCRLSFDWFHSPSIPFVLAVGDASPCLRLICEYSVGPVGPRVKVVFAVSRYQEPKCSAKCLQIPELSIAPAWQC